MKANNQTEETDTIVKAKTKREDSDTKRIKAMLIGDAKPVSVFTLYLGMSTTNDKFMMLLGLIGSIGAGVSMPMNAYLMGSTMSAFGPTNSTETILSSISRLVNQFLFVGTGMYVAYVLSATFWTIAALNQLNRYKQEYFKMIMEQEQGWFDKNNAFEFSTKVQSQIKQIEGGMGDKLGNVIQSLSMFLTGITIALITDWKLALVLIACVPLMASGVILAASAMKNGAIISRKAYEKAGGIAEEILYSIKTIASFANFDHEIERYNALIANSRVAGIKNALIVGAGFGFMFFVLFCMCALDIYYGSVLIVQKDKSANGNEVQGGNVYTILLAIISACFSLGNSSANIRAIAEACLAASDFYSIKARKSEMNIEGKIKPDKEGVIGKVIFNNVKFAYPTKPDLDILKGISFTIEPGQSTALVGESGSGKSTIVNLVERLYDPTDGSVILDSINIKDLDIKYLRSLIGYVQQEPVLFNTSIRDNIIFGREDITDEMIWEATDKAYARQFIQEKGGLDYIVGIKGSKLSGGQKQRIAIARAILMKPKLLILDEATSALDNKSEKEVQMALEKVSEGVTTIIIAHRLTTIRNAHKIIAMRMGEIIEVGSHDVLLSKGGYYKSLIDSQINTVKNNHNNIITPNEQAAAPVNNKEDINLITPEKEDNKNFETNRIYVKTEANLNEKEKTPEKTIKKDKDDSVVIKKARQKLFSMLKDKYCLLFLAALAAACNGTVFPTYGVIMASAIEKISSPDPNVVLSEGTFLAGMLVIIAIASGLSLFFQNYLFISIGEYLCEKLRSNTFIKSLSFEMGYYDYNENSPGAILTKLSSDTTQLNGVVLAMVGVLTQSAANLSVGIALALVYDYRLALISMAFTPFIILSGVLQHKVRKGLVQGDERLDVEAGSILSESVVNSKTIFSYNMQNKVYYMYGDILEPSRKKIVPQSISTGLIYGIGQFATFATYAVVYYAGGSFIVNHTLTFGNMLRAIFCILYAAMGVSMAQQHIGDISKAKLAADSLFQVLDRETEINPFKEANKDKISANLIQGRIEFRNVTFSYPTKRDVTVLKDVNFIIESGQKVAFVGFSGSGKSTIVQLIERFYDIQEGSILLDGIDIKDYNLYELRKKIGLVSQEPTLFKTTVMENIRCGKLDATDQEIEQVAKHSRIDYLFKGPESGTKDTPMSGGEKQRVAIARLMIKNPKIVLLDEATSALDNDNEKEVQKSLDILMKGRTSISIAHRLSTIENCDRIFFIENGEIVEYGTHSELLSKTNKYYGLYNSQVN